MRMTLTVIAAAALIGGTAFAGPPPQQAASAQVASADQAATAVASTPVASVTLHVCDEEAADWRLFSRDLGLPDFVTAKQVRAGKAGSGAKCITPSELRRLKGEQVGALVRKPPR